MRKKCLHQPKFLILFIILTSAWFSKNVQVLSVRIAKRSKASSARLSSKTFLGFLRAFLHSCAFDIATLRSSVLKIEPFVSYSQQKYVAAHTKAFYWLNKLVNTNWQAIPFSCAFENILSHFTLTIKELCKTFWSICVDVSCCRKWG